jgi:hypothetical protein
MDGWGEGGHAAERNCRSKKKFQGGLKFVRLSLLIEFGTERIEKLKINMVSGEVSVILCYV